MQMNQNSCVIRAFFVYVWLLSVYWHEKGEERPKTLDEIGDIPNKIHTFTSESKNKLEYENYSSDGKLEVAGCSQDGFPLLAASSG